VKCGEGLVNACMMLKNSKIGGASGGIWGGLLNIKSFSDEGGGDRRFCQGLERSGKGPRDPTGSKKKKSQKSVRNTTARGGRD